VATIVSILTRPESRVLRHPNLSGVMMAMSFQSSPGPKAGCFNSWMAKVPVL